LFGAELFSKDANENVGVSCRLRLGCEEEEDWGSDKLR
jgi:hypothetical protein